MTRPPSSHARLGWGLSALTAALLLAAPAFAEDAPPKIDTGDTA